MDIINSIDIILINLQQMKQDSCINNKDRNIHQFLCDLSCDLQKINNLLKSYSPKNDNCEEKINNLENKIVCLEKELMNSNNKAVIVGMLCKKGFRKTYNWIVQRTTKILYKAMDYTKGLTIYANTDGYVISDPFNKLETTKDLGNFKLEYSGDVFVYQAKNYWLMQCGNELKGSCLRSVRKNIDLSKGQVVNYDRKRILIKDNLYINIAENQNIQIKEIING